MALLTDCLNSKLDSYKTNVRDPSKSRVIANSLAEANATVNAKKGLLLVLIVVGCFPNAHSSDTPSTKLKWKKSFPKEVSWYVRTSPGILLVRSGKSLTALDGEDGRQLWQLPEVDWSMEGLRDAEYQRGKNAMEVPGMGVLLLNRVRFPGDPSGRLVAVNLLTGDRLWDDTEIDDLMAVLPLRGGNEIVLACVRLQKKVLAERLAVSAAAGIPSVAYAAVIAYPYRVVLQRREVLTGKLRWSKEYPKVFSPGTQSFLATGNSNNIYLYSSDTTMAAVSIKDGDRNWDDTARSLSLGAPLPFGMAHDKLIYSLKGVRAVDTASGKVIWEIGDLGKVTGLLINEDVIVALGNKSVAGVDAKSGAELWRSKTHGHCTNLSRDPESDTVTYLDGSGLHRLERLSGKSLLDAPIKTVHHAFYVRLTDGSAVVAISDEEVCVYDLKSGKRIFATGSVNGFFPAVAIHDRWPMTIDEQSEASAAGRAPEAIGYTKDTLLSGVFLKRVEEAASDAYSDAYQTQDEKGVDTIWWADPKTNEQIAFHISGSHRDVSRPMGRVFAVEGNEIWAASWADDAGAK